MTERASKSPSTARKTSVISLQEKNDSGLSRAYTLARAAWEKNAENIRVLDLRGISGFTDYFVLCNAMSDRQAKTVSDHMEFKLEKPSKVEGYLEGRWILQDYGDVVVHIFLDALREYYDLDRLWAHAPKVKLPDDLFEPSASQMN